MENEIILKFEEALNSYSVDGETSPQTIMCKAFELIKQNADFCTCLLSNNGEMTFFNKLKTIIRDACFKYWTELFSRPKKVETFDYFFNFMLYGCIGIIESWLNSGLKELSSSQNKFASGVKNYVSSANSLDSAYDNIDNGISSAYKGASSLNSGLNQLGDGVDSLISSTSKVDSLADSVSQVSSKLSSSDSSELEAQITALAQKAAADGDTELAAQIKQLEKEIENLKTLEIKGLINEVDIPYEELVKMIKELKN